jgi:membrane-bound ClpP family serine protease
MLAARWDSASLSARPRSFRPFALIGVSLVALAVLAGPRRALAADAARADGLFISVPNPITDDSFTRIKNRIEDARKRKDRPIRTIVFDFNPNNAAGHTTNFYTCQRLADYLLHLSNELRTVAYVHNTVKGHTVLPVLACTELIMSGEAQLGDVALDRTDPDYQSALQSYQRLARLRKPLSPDLILKMLDRNLGILQGKTRDNQTRYVGYPRGRHDQKLKEAQDSRLGFREPAEVPELAPGIARYSGTMAREYGLCRDDLVSSREEVARLYGLQLRLREDLLQGQPIHAWRIEISGEATTARLNSVRRKIDRAIGKGGNFFILQLDCESGDTVAAGDFAKYLHNLKDDKGAHPVQTVAYIPPRRSLGAPTAIALGCTEIIMARDKAFLGDFAYLKDEDPAHHAKLAEHLEALAREQGAPSLLLRATLDPDLVLVEVESNAHPGNRFLVTEAKFLEDQKTRRKWGRPAYLKNKGELIKIDAALADRLHLTCCLVDDLDGVYKHYGLKPEDVQQASSDLLDDIETFFQNPFVRILLVMIGIVGLILEMKMPGVGLPGVVAAVCFVLFFWAHSGVGHFTWLAILLFVLGLILIGLEVFLLPGMAVFGISGIVLVVASLVLVTLEKAPTTTRDWWSLGMTLSTYTFSMIGALVVAFLLARYLPQIPYANRLMLAPPTDDRPDTAEGGKPSAVDAHGSLLGAIGEAATPLRPSGKARFGEEYLDVIAEGSYVNAGKRVQVIEIEGNRIVVKEV